MTLSDFETGLLDRLRFASTLATARLRLPANQTALAEEVARRMGQNVAQSKISRWLSLSSEPPLLFFVALAGMAGVDPGWLTMGSLSAAPEPAAYLPLHEPARDEDLEDLSLDAAAAPLRPTPEKRVSATREAAKKAAKKRPA